MKIIFLIVIIFVNFSVHAHMANVPKSDLNNIKCLFTDLIQHHDFAYAIFGSKPMVLADKSFKIRSHLSAYQYIMRKYQLFKKKNHLKSWYQYKSEFDLKDFIFLDKEEDLLMCLALVLINKKNLLEVLHSHKAIFKDELGSSFTPEMFLRKIEKREISLSKAIHNNQRLLGIMLGYGDRNATLYNERLKLLEEIENRENSGLSQDSELMQKLNAIEANTDCFNDLDREAILQPLYFLADLSHPETIELKKVYKEDQLKIAELMQQPDFIDKVLNRLVQ